MFLVALNTYAMIFFFPLMQKQYSEKRIISISATKLFFLAEILKILKKDT